MKFSVKHIWLKGVGEKLRSPVNEQIDKLDLPEEIQGKTVEGEIVFTKLEESILVNAKLIARVVLICDRCLSNFDKTLRIDLEREYNINRQGRSEEGLYVDKYGDIFLDEPLREEVILAIPMKNLCTNTCAGICPNCGENMNKNKCQCKNSLKSKSNNSKS